MVKRFFFVANLESKQSDAHTVVGLIQLNAIVIVLRDDSTYAEFTVQLKLLKMNSQILASYSTKCFFTSSRNEILDHTVLQSRAVDYTMMKKTKNWVAKRKTTNIE